MDSYTLIFILEVLAVLPLIVISWIIALALVDFLILNGRLYDKISQHLKNKSQ